MSSLLFFLFLIRCSSAKIVEIFLHLLYIYVDNWAPITNLKKIIEKNCHAVTKLDTHLAKTGHIYIYMHIEWKEKCDFTYIYV